MNLSFDYDVIYSDRKTMQITVTPDGFVIIRAPKKTDYQIIRHRVFKRRKWIQKKLSFFNENELINKSKYFLNGEHYLYLGRNYGLRIIQDKKDFVKLTRGTLEIHVKNIENKKNMRDILDKWYRERAKIKFKEFLNNHFTYFKRKGFSIPEIIVRKMKTRWGSLSGKENITLNLELIKVPSKCVEYVICHELCHLKYKQHDRRFYLLLSRIFPDWEKTKEKLDKFFIKK